MTSEAMDQFTAFEGFPVSGDAIQQDAFLNDDFQKKLLFTFGGAFIISLVYIYYISNQGQSESQEGHDNDYVEAHASSGTFDCISEASCYNQEVASASESNLGNVEQFKRSKATMSNSSFGYHGEQVNQRYNDGQSNVSHPVSTQ